MNQQQATTQEKSTFTPPRAWLEVRHPVTNSLVAKYCHETNQLEVVDRGKRGIITLPNK